jgi:serine/threonine protein kinase
MADWNPSANSIFLTVRDLPPGDARAGYLNEACGADGALREAVIQLLDADAAADGFLETPVAWAGSAERPHEQYEKSGDRLGPYTLRELMGEGGMGLVYAAEQAEPVVRHVAVKIIKPGMDSRKVIARFEAERQALAMMDHPNIAKVFDAGTTAAGRPYFVMELVTGLPISAYSDQHKLSIRERLELFLPVCHAVQHAHQKGIIHRDLKPSNVIIAQYDGRPVPKVIDFGVSKAMGAKLTDATLHTEHGIVIGTLEYMSPEQAELHPLDVDTRSDVYSLGVILYELVAGTTPLEPARLRSTPFDELRRIVREEPPIKPSARLNNSPALPALAASRRLDPQRVSREVRADLDWIIMKTLEKDRNRRYESASALARDIERFLANEPIEARPPSLTYRFRKFARRHRGPVAMAATLALAVLMGGCISAWLAVKASRAEGVARRNAAIAQRAAIAERQAKLEAAAQRDLAEERFKFLAFSAGIAHFDLEEDEMTRIVDHISTRSEDSFQGDAELQAAFLLHLGKACWKMHRYAEAERQLRRVLAIAREPTVVIDAREILGYCLLRLGRYAEASDVLKTSFEDLLGRISTPGADELRAAWPGLDDAEPPAGSRSSPDGLEMDGETSFIIIPRLYFDGRPPWTLETIIRPADIGQFSVRGSTRWTSLISVADGGGLGLETSQSRWSFGMYSVTDPVRDPLNDYTTAAASEAVRLRRWQHLAGVWDGAEMRLYINGRLASTSKNVTSCAYLSKWPFYIGADPCDPWHGHLAEGLFKGRIRAVRISRGVEYAHDFQPPKRLEKTPDAVGLYDFTIDTGRYAIDRSGHANHGIIVGAKFEPSQ